MFSLGSEGLNIRPSRVALPSSVFTCLLVCVLYSDNCRGYASFKGSSELTPCVLMITWSSGWRASKLYIRSYRNRSWRLPLRALRHRMWNSPNMLTIWCVRWRNPLHILVIASGSGQMRIWTRISSRSRPTLIWSSWNRMRTTSLVNLLVGWCMWRTLTYHKIHLWTMLEQSNGWICTRSSTVQPLKKTVLDLIKESLTDFRLTSYLIDEVQIGSVDSVSKLWEDIYIIIKTRVRSTSETVVDEVQHQRDRTLLVHKVCFQSDIPTMSTPTFSNVLCLGVMCGVEKVNQLLNRWTVLFYFIMNQENEMGSVIPVVIHT